MRLEDEIHVLVPFESHRQKAIVNVAYTYGVFLERTLKVLRTYDINDQHYNILKTLHVHDPEPVSVGEIKRLMINKRGDITRLLDKLDAMKLIDRAVDPQNRRVVLVSITAQGKQQLAEMDRRLSTERDQVNQLTEQEAQQLNDLLDKLRS
jgi:DNA-binding MarR family transcriptional regulator